MILFANDAETRDSLKHSSVFGFFLFVIILIIPTIRDDTLADDWPTGIPGDWQVYWHLLFFLESFLKNKNPSSLLFPPHALPLSFNTHSFKHCSLSHGGSPGTWQGRISRWEVDRQGWQNKNHAPQFNGWPDGDVFLSTPRSRPPPAALPHLLHVTASYPNLPNQAWQACSVTQQHRRQTRLINPPAGRLREAAGGKRGKERGRRVRNREDENRFR